ALLPALPLCCGPARCLPCLHTPSCSMLRCRKETTLLQRNPPPALRAPGAGLALSTVQAVPDCPPSKQTLSAGAAKAENQCRSCSPIPAMLCNMH
uniref:Uncharacterized protein n=1 Tax=Pavo cristatus TaxID=9049 RepID=A0A8C9EGX2_PAVCR